MFVSEGSVIDVSKKASFFSINRGKFHKHKRKNDRVSENKDEEEEDEESESHLHGRPLIPGSIPGVCSWGNPAQTQVTQVTNTSSLLLNLCAIE